MEQDQEGGDQARRSAAKQASACHERLQGDQRHQRQDVKAKADQRQAQTRDLTRRCEVQMDEIVIGHRQAGYVRILQRPVMLRVGRERKSPGVILVVVNIFFGRGVAGK